MAEIGWIDFSTRDRKKAQQLMSLIRPEGQLDELGVGYLRDALANQLFPGISTIQTRAKYFFIIPCILRDYQKLSPKEKSRTNARQFLKEQQHSVKNLLRENYNYEEGLGIIGVTLHKNKYVKRNPSEIYWNGLRVFGFMNEKELSLYQYLRNLSAHRQLEKSKSTEEEDDADSTYEEVLHINTPVNNNWLDELSIELTQPEADFFASQILHSAQQFPVSLLPQLLKNDALNESFLTTGNFEEFVTASLDLDMEPPVKQLLILAHDFALVMEGLHLLYNDLLQKHIFPNDYDNSFEEKWLKWRKGLKNSMLEYNNFSPSNLYNYSKNRSANTEVFINSWWKMITESKHNVLPTAQMKGLVKQRELFAKRKKARLSKPASANNDVYLYKRLGLSLFQYRFYNVQTILSDINNPED